MYKLLKINWSYLFFFFFFFNKQHTNIDVWFDPISSKLYLSSYCYIYILFTKQVLYTLIISICDIKFMIISRLNKKNKKKTQYLSYSTSFSSWSWLIYPDALHAPRSPQDIVYVNMFGFSLVSGHIFYIVYIYIRPQYLKSVVCCVLFVAWCPKSKSTINKEFYFISNLLFFFFYIVIKIKLLNNIIFYF